MASNRAFFGIVFAPVGPLAVPIAFFSHLEPFRIPQTAHDLCIFSLRSPVNKNDRMHHTDFFVNFVAIDATFSFLVRFRSVLGPFWVHCKRFFSKCCFLPTRGAQFCKTASSAFDQTNPLFRPPNGNEMTPKCGNVAPKSPKNDPKRLVCAKNAPSMYRISFAEMSISRLKRLVIEFRTNFDRVLTANDPKTAPKWPEATLGCPK